MFVGVTVFVGVFVGVLVEVLVGVTVLVTVFGGVCVDVFVGVFVCVIVGVGLITGWHTFQSLLLFSHNSSVKLHTQSISGVILGVGVFVCVCV